MMLLILGIIAAGFGGELFVRGVIGLSAFFRIPPGIIGATVAAFATSSPEAAVAIRAASQGTPEIAMGDALGSNIVNIALILGIALVFAPIKAQRSALERDIYTAFGAPVLLAALVMDGQLSFYDGLLLLGVFAIWLFFCARESLRSPSAAAEVIGVKPHQAILFSLIGIALLIAAGRFIVTGGLEIAASYHLNAYVVGATLIAFGTSTPELATVVMARLKNQDAIGLGTALGSNIFNNLFIIGMAAVIHPIRGSLQQVMISIVIGLVTVFLVFPDKRGNLPKTKGYILLSLYVVYFVATVLFSKSI